MGQKTFVEESTTGGKPHLLGLVERIPEHDGVVRLVAAGLCDEHDPRDWLLATPDHSAFLCTDELQLRIRQVSERAVSRERLFLHQTRSLSQCRPQPELMLRYEYGE